MHTVHEGSIELRVPGEDGTASSVFYNPEQELNRDITIGVLREVKTNDPMGGSYLDAMTATGVRGLRAAKNDWAVTCVDVNPEAIGLCRSNFRRNGLQASIRRRDANVELYQHGFDVVDIDPFGTPIPYLDSAFHGTRQLLCVTATDTAPLCGAHFESGVRRYGAVPINTEYHAEVGVRILLGAIARTAARYDVGVTPVLTHATRHYVRSYLMLDRSAATANAVVKNLGFIYHCWDCLWRTTEAGFLPSSPEECPSCGSSSLTTGGPLWVEPINDSSFIEGVQASLTDEMETLETAHQLLSQLKQELSSPTHYDHHQLCNRWNQTAIQMDTLIERLEDTGFPATRTHYGGTTFKTTASVSEIREAITE